MQSFDTIVRGGTVLDGTGGEPFSADVGITSDRISAIGDLSDAHASREINARGLRVAPGFIDIHTHSDISVLFHPQQESIVSQGVTTQVVGNCSLCLGLATDADVFVFEKRVIAAHGLRINWDTLDAHLRRVEGDGVATNYIMLAGQGTLRKRYVGLEKRPPTRDEMDSMKRELHRSLQAGAWGLSTGLEYTPSGYANVDELSELSEVVREYGGFYASHLRNEGDTLVEAVAEAIEIGERAQTPVQLSHHKAEGRSNWGKVRTTLKMVEDANARGLDVQLDQYPYTAFQTSLAVQFLPDWANVGDNEVVLARLADPSTRRQIIADVKRAHPDWEELGPESPWRSVEIGVCRNNRAIQGRTIHSLAEESATSPIELILDIILSESNFVSGINFAINEDDISFVMQHPLTMIGSDAVGVAPHGKMGEDKVHPRSYGTFPRVLSRYVREKATISEADAIRKMTSMPARRMRLPLRGELKVGNFADIVIYDAATIADNATFATPHQFSSGIEWTIVNGTAVWKSGASTGSLAGRVLRRGSNQ